MKNAPWVVSLVLALIVGFAAGLFVQQRFGLIIRPKPANSYSADDVMNVSRSAYIEGYYSGSEAALKGRFKAAGDEQYKEALTWRLDHPDFPFILEKEPGQ